MEKQVILMKEFYFIISLLDVKDSKKANTIVVDTTMFKVSSRILTLIVIILGILLALYIKFW